MNKRVIIVGGVFDLTGGRPSRYINAFADVSESKFSDFTIVKFNGGFYSELSKVKQLAKDAFALFWFADIPNDLPKILPSIKESNPQILLVQSKNNSSEKYSTEALIKRMQASKSEFLVEFKKTDAGITADLLSPGWVGANSKPRITSIAPILRMLRVTDETRFPIRDCAPWAPVGQHAGAFGVRRKFHTHEGVDLYVPEGTAVRPMCFGNIVYIGPFTGPSAGHPYWNDTQCIMVRHFFGVINYGEIIANPKLKVGSLVDSGIILGTVTPVLKKDKGLPMSMLHVERYAMDTTKPVFEWGLDQDQPMTLLDPTGLLLISK